MDKIYLEINMLHYFCPKLNTEIAWFGAMWRANRARARITIGIRYNQAGIETREQEHE